MFNGNEDIIKSMEKFFYVVCAFLILLFWPISFLLANGQSWEMYFLAAGLLFIDWLLYLKHFKDHYFLYLLFPLLHPAFLLFPIIAVLFNFDEVKKPLTLAIFTGLLVVVSLVSFKTFYAYSIFTPDPLAFDTINKKIAQIPNRNLARFYVNKTSIPLDKLKSNLFISLDHNNYFFALHPREIGDNQNLNKFPYLAIIPFLFGLFTFPKNKHKKWLAAIFLASIFSIGFINNQDKFDLIVFIPISLLCLFGLKKLLETSKMGFYVFITIFIPVTLVELSRIIILK